jgi:hypothetical protein
MAEIARTAAADVNIDPADNGGYLTSMSDQDIARFRAQVEECRHRQSAP